jgi:hypothetical protein
MMTKGRIAISFGFATTDDEQQVPQLRYASVPRQAGTGGMTLLLRVEGLIREIRKVRSG